MNKRLYTAIGLLSASMIAFQLALMQILSISQWNHFAYMVISVALLSFWRKWYSPHIFKKLVDKAYRIKFAGTVAANGYKHGALLCTFRPGIWWLAFDSYLLLDKAISLD